MRSVYRSLRAGVVAVGLLAALAAGACEKSDSSDPAKPATTGGTVPAAPATQPAAVAAASQPAAVGAGLVGRPSTQPGRIGPGDLLVVDVAELNGPGTSTPKPVRVEADGTVPLLFIAKPFPIAGMTTADAQLAIGKAYNEANILQHALVYVRRLQVGGAVGTGSAGGAVAGPIGNFDLLRVVVWELMGPASESVRIVRVGPDGVVGLPFLGKVPVAGLTAGQVEAAISKDFREKNILQNAQVAVLRLEAAPPDAGQVDLPDAPIYPVPDLLRPLYDLGPSAPPPPAVGRK